MVCSGVRQSFSDLPSQYRIDGGYNVRIRFDRNSSDYLFGRLARTRFVSGIALANAPLRSFLHFQSRVPNSCRHSCLGYRL
jgi:hypothetical protein